MAQTKAGGEEDKNHSKPSIRTFDRTLTQRLTRTHYATPEAKPKAKLLFVTQLTDLRAHY